MNDSRGKEMNNAALPLFLDPGVPLFLPSSSTLLCASPPLLATAVAGRSSFLGATSVTSPVGGAPSNRLLPLPPLLFLSSSVLSVGQR